MTSLRNDHMEHKIPDFVLGLLTIEEEQVVKAHIALCSDCRQSVQQEREIGRLVFTTLNKAGRPNQPKLQTLMPPVEKRRQPILAALIPYRQWAIACLLIITMTGAFLSSGDLAYSGLGTETETYPATISSINGTVTFVPPTTRQANKFISGQNSDAPNQPAFEELEQHQPPAQLPPVAPQETPEPASTYDN